MTTPEIVSATIVITTNDGTVRTFSLDSSVVVIDYVFTTTQSQSVAIHVEAERRGLTNGPLIEVTVETPPMPEPPEGTVVQLPQGRIFRRGWAEWYEPGNEAPYTWTYILHIGKPKILS